MGVLGHSEGPSEGRRNQDLSGTFPSLVKSASMLSISLFAWTLAPREQAGQKQRWFRKSGCQTFCQKQKDEEDSVEKAGRTWRGLLPLPACLPAEETVRKSLRSKKIRVERRLHLNKQTNKYSVSSDFQNLGRHQLETATVGLVGGGCCHTISFSPIKSFLCNDSFKVFWDGFYFARRNSSLPFKPLLLHPLLFASFKKRRNHSYYDIH